MPLCRGLKSNRPKTYAKVRFHELVMDEALLPVCFQAPDQNMMNYPVTEVSGEDLPPLRLLNQKCHRWARPIRACRQLFVQTHKIPLQVLLETEGIYCPTFAAAATLIRPEDTFHTE